jgi:hypothetical protein
MIVNIATITDKEAVKKTTKKLQKMKRKIRHKRLVLHT